MKERCEACGAGYQRSWSATSGLWNPGNVGALRFLCPSCFADRCSDAIKFELWAGEVLCVPADSVLPQGIDIEVVSVAEADRAVGKAKTPAGGSSGAFARLHPSSE